MFRKRDKEVTELVAKLTEPLVEALNESRKLVAELRGKAEELETRLSRLETSDFSKNRDDYVKMMNDLVDSNPAVQLFP